MRKVAMKIARAPKQVTLLPMRGIIVMGSIISYMYYFATFPIFFSGCACEVGDPCKVSQAREPRRAR